MAVRQGKVIEARLVREGKQHKLYLFHVAERAPMVDKIEHHVFAGEQGKFRMIEIDPVIKKDLKTLFTMRIVGQDLDGLSDEVHKKLSSWWRKPQKLHGIVLYGDRFDAPYTVFTLGPNADPEKIRKVLAKGFVTADEEPEGERLLPRLKPWFGRA